MADEFLDVHSPVAQRAAFPVGLGDFGLERDDTLKAWHEVGHLLSWSPWSPAGLAGAGQRCVVADLFNRARGISGNPARPGNMAGSLGAADSGGERGRV
jgi:hypothetical protein